MKRPFYIGSGKAASFAVFDPAEGSQRDGRPPVLICPPWGWTDVASYRARHDWATQLAAAGFPTLRFDLPATGNSAGEVTDTQLTASWVAATLAAATWLADAEGAGAGIAALGIGLGGLLALAAIAAGAPIAALALWGAPGRGKRFVRETQAFSRMQPWLADEAGGEGFDPGVPDGWIEAGGFALTAETVAELKAMSAEVAPGSGLARALLLDRDGIGVDPELTTALERGGVAVEHAAGVGWEDFVSHPELAVVPERTADELARWLVAEPVAKVDAPDPPPAAETLELDVDGVEVRENTLSLSESWGRTVGIITEPATSSGDDLCAVFLNAGAVRSIGPNRMWVETARRWAAAGVPTLRFDLQGIGEADGEGAGQLQIGDFYEPHFGFQVPAMLDELESLEIGRRFVLVGLCSGGYWGFRTAVADPRVVAILQLNAGALRWLPDLPRQREAHRTTRALERRWLRKLMRGEIEPSRIIHLLQSVFLTGLGAVRDAVGRLFGRQVNGSLRPGIEGDLDVLRDRGTRVLIALSGDELLGEELEREELLGRSDRWPNVEFATLPGRDHTLRPLAAQRAAAELLDRELARLIAAARPSAV